jgi:primase-polymerase (primpol)-like protein
MRGQIIMAINVDGIAEELKKLNQWVCWNKEIRDGKETKIPYIALMQIGASVTNPQHYKPFNIALDSYNKKLHEGIGFVFTKDDPCCFIDLDHCIDENGIIEPDSQRIIDILNSYTEISQSGLGIHIIVKACLPEGAGNRKGNFEIYTQGRYCAMTGNVLKGYPVTIEERQEQVNQICSEIFKKPEPEQKLSTREPSTITLSDQEIIEKASKAKNSEKFNRLMSGQWQAEYPSQSEADLALCYMLAFWTPDTDQIDRLFRQSGLYRDKWDRADYRNDTINKALENTTEHYKPGGNHSNNEKSSKGDPVTEKAEQSKSEPSGPKEKSKNPKVSEFDKHKEQVNAILSKHDLNTDIGKKSALQEADTYVKRITNPSIAGKLWDIVKKELNLTDIERDIELTFKNAKELGKMDIPEISWIVPGIIPEGLTLLCGKPKMGKSWLSLGLGVGVASGGRAFGSIDLFEYQGKVLYLALEDNDRRMKNRLTKLCMGSEFPENLTYVTEIKRGTEGIKIIKSWLEKNKEDVRLVVIDTLVSFRGKSSGKINEYERDSNDMQSIQQLAGDYGIGIILVHHLRKAIADDDFDTISGTLGLTGKADTNLILKRARGEADAILKGTGRDLDEDIDFNLKFDPSNATWNIVSRDTKEYSINQEREDILKALQENKEGIKIREISIITGRKEQNLRQILYRMKKEGIVILTKDDKYIVR